MRATRGGEEVGVETVLPHNTRGSTALTVGLALPASKL